MVFFSGHHGSNTSIGEIYARTRNINSRLDPINFNRSNYAVSYA
ncbi:unnamed protein product [Acidithrix sp. C25]|nr:unnamed protein product [Acidithrix sp. C25]